MTCRLTYAQLSRMHRNALWAVDTYWQLGLYHVAIKYTKIANRIHNAMIKFPAENVQIGGMI